MKSKPTHKFIAAKIIGLALTAGSTNAAVLASYIDGTDADEAALVNLTTPSGYTASDLTLNSLGTGTSITITTVGSQTTPGGTEWLNVPRAITNTATPTNTNSSFIAFNISGTGGNMLDLTSLTFDAATATDASNGYQFFYQLYASTDGTNYSTVGGVGSSPSVASFGVSSVVNQSIDLTGLANASTYHFQLYLGDNASTGNKAGLIQNYNLNGEIVAIPEPSASLLLGLGGLALLRRRRSA